MNGHRAVVLTVFNSKGGCGKTTVTVNLAGTFSKEFGYKVLVVDSDTQASATTALGRSEDPVAPFEDLLLEYADDKSYIGDVHDAICRTNFDNLDIIPIINKDKYAKVARALNIDHIDGIWFFKDFFERVLEEYDFIILDAGAGEASLNPLAHNALNMSDALLIPFFADLFNLEGFENVKKTFEQVKRKNNPNLFIAGTFLSRNNSSSLSKSAIEAGAENIGESFLNVSIRESNEIANAVLEAKPVCYHRPKSGVAGDFIALANAILERLEAHINGQ